MAVPFFSADLDVVGAAHGREPERSLVLLAVLSDRLRGFFFKMVSDYSCLATPQHLTVDTELSEIGIQSEVLVKRGFSTLSEFVFSSLE